VNTAKLNISVLLIALVSITGLVPACNTSPSSTGQTGKVIFQDDFKDPNSGWFVYKQDETKVGKYEAGDYSVSSSAKNTVVVLNPKTRQNIGDFAVEVDVKKTSGDTGTALGIIYRLNNDGKYYRFAITDNQTFWIGKNDGGFEKQLYEMKSSPYIKPAAEGNRLKVVCNGLQQEVYVNDNKVATVSDNTSLKGELGMAFSNFGTLTASYTFSNFVLRSTQ
jgi:hypothetical protein